MLKPLERVAKTIQESDFIILWANVTSGGMFKFPPSITVHVAAMETQPIRKVRDSNEGLA